MSCECTNVSLRENVFRSKILLSCFLKMFWGSVARIARGRLFQRRGAACEKALVRSFVCDLMTTVLYINVQFVQPVCCCLVQGKKVAIALCVGA